MLASLGAPQAALAHGADDSDMSLVLVRQAIAYIVNTPGNMDAIADKINDATEAEDQSEVKIPLVEQAKQTLDSGDMHKVRALLEQAASAPCSSWRCGPAPAPRNSPPGRAGQPRPRRRPHPTRHSGPWPEDWTGRSARCGRRRPERT